MNRSMRDLIAGELLASADVKRWAAENLADDIARAADASIRALREGRTLLFAGNGGSAADAQHLAAEFVGRFIDDRPALRAIALTVDTSALTAIGNDYGYDQVFRRQVEALGQDGDVLFLITTSGNSRNLLCAAEEARRRNITTVGLLGRDGGKLAPMVDIPIVVRSEQGRRVQECHIAIGHAVCLAVEAALFG
ncbi:MAG: SIS domain-containing protein [Dehalococcoidia bacterium]